MRVWIDPGHGGTDPGAVSGLRRECDDTLTYALELERQFAAQGCEVVMTRHNDVSVTLDDRTKLERSSKCNLAISCHRNAGTEGANGAEIWLHSNAPDNYKTWAEDVLGGLAEVGFKPRGVKLGYVGNPAENYAVNRDTNAPSMMIEAGFVTDECDNAIFDKSVSQICTAIVKASLKFLGVEYVPPIKAISISELIALGYNQITF